MGRAGKDKTARKENCFPRRVLPGKAIRLPSREPPFTFLVPQIGMEAMDNARANVLPLQLKILLNARIGHYGFVLAMPASL